MDLFPPQPGEERLRAALSCQTIKQEVIKELIDWGGKKWAVLDMRMCLTTPRRTYTLYEVRRAGQNAPQGVSWQKRRTEGGEDWDQHNRVGLAAMSGDGNGGPWVVMPHKRVVSFPPINLPTPRSRPTPMQPAGARPIKGKVKLKKRGIFRGHMASAKKTAAATYSPILTTNRTEINPPTVLTLPELLNLIAESGQQVAELEKSLAKARHTLAARLEDAAEKAKAAA